MVTEATTEPTEETVAPEAEPTEVTPSEAPSRKAAEYGDRQKARADKATNRYRDTLLDKLGLKADKGTGKAIVTIYEDDWLDANETSLRAFAEDNDFPLAPPAGTMTKEEQVIANAQATTTTVASAAETVPESEPAASQVQKLNEESMRLVDEDPAAAEDHANAVLAYGAAEMLGQT